MIIPGYVLTAANRLSVKAKNLSGNERTRSSSTSFVGNHSRRSSTKDVIAKMSGFNFFRVRLLFCLHYFIIFFVDKKPFVSLQPQSKKIARHFNKIVRSMISPRMIKVCIACV